MKYIVFLIVVFVSTSVYAVGPYLNNGNVVIDQGTDLVWQQSNDINNDGVIAEGSYPTGDALTWQEALAWCENLTIEEKSDWRLPNIRELQSIVDWTRNNPALNPNFQYCDRWCRWHWSSTNIENGYSAYTVNFDTGSPSAQIKTRPHNFRCVRGGNVIPSSEFDTDGDGLPDDWEIYGIDGVDLKSLGADPTRKDIFVYYDWLKSGSHDHDPHNLVVVIDAFAKQGIYLHIVRGQAIAEGLTHRVIDNWDEFDSIKNSYFPPKYRRIFHYCLFGHKLWPNEEGKYPSGVSKNLVDFRAGASDFMVTISNWENYLESEQKDINYRYYIYAGTFMHELGHNLGLGHGGMVVDSEGNSTGQADHTLYKPNHLSVMNYVFQTRGLDIGKNFPILDYSNFRVDDINFLDETNLNESMSIGKNHIKLAKYTSSFFCPGTDNRVEIKNLFQPVDWNCDGNVDDASISVSINQDELFESLATVNEWDNLVFTGGTIGSKETPLFKASVKAPNFFIFKELTFEEDVNWGPYIPGPSNFFWPLFLPAINARAK